MCCSCAAGGPGAAAESWGDSATWVWEAGKEIGMTWHPEDSVVSTAAARTGAKVLTPSAQEALGVVVELKGESVGKGGIRGLLAQHSPPLAARMGEGEMSLCVERVAVGEQWTR